MNFELESHVNDHGRAYQQGLGPQFNFENAYFAGGDDLLPQIFKGPIDPLVRESDPLEMGVHRAPMARGNAVPPYVTRDVDIEISAKFDSAIKHGGLVLIVGDSTAGKSRSAYETILRVAPDHRLVAPLDRDQLRNQLVSLISGSNPALLWLDNMERYVGLNGLTPRIASHLRAAGIAVIGTMRTEHYRALTALVGPRSRNDSRGHSELISAEHVLNLADTVFMERRWTAGEMERANRVEDPRVADAVKHGRTYGVAEYLAAGPMLYREWQMAWMVGGNPHGAALIAAAIDCHRAGLHDSIDIQTLRDISEPYLEDAGGAVLRPEVFEDAISWASHRRYGVTSMLLPGKRPGTYRAFDYLVDKVMRSTDAKPVPEYVWDAVLMASEGDNMQMHEIAAAAQSQGNHQIAVKVWEGQAAAGISSGAHNVALLHLRAGRSDEAEYWLQNAFELGSLASATELGHLLEDSVRLEEAATWYEKAAAGGNAHAMYHVGWIQRNKGNDAEAEKWFRRAIEKKDESASSGLGALLIESGRFEEAESLLRSAGDGGDGSAMIHLGIAFISQERTEDAEEAWLKALELGAPEAAINLAKMNSKIGRKAEAEKWYRRAIVENVSGAKRELGVFLSRDRRRLAEAEDLIREAAAGQDLYAYLNLAEILLIRQRNEEAEQWFRKAIQGGIKSAVPRLAQSLEEMGRIEDSIPLWQQLVDEGDEEATFALAKVKKNQGAFDDAMRLFRIAADAGDSAAACEVARLHRLQRDSAGYEAWLKISLKGGHVHAACLLGYLFSSRGDFGPAESFWTNAYKGGHFHVASELATLLARQGRGDEAATWLRRVNGGNRGRSGGRRAGNRKARRKK
ncbi:tetratricopeptide repeat protein [Micromonospora profundi]|uniref:tetratricopeptide repeat protein n=1 Tax=Micromonospora profundi TaxID=1420889 RepID=UPI0033A53D22